MEQWNAKQLRQWMDGWLVRELTDVPDAVELDGSIRIAAFDGIDRLRGLYCIGMCAVKENTDKGYRLYAMEQGLKLLHFALRELAPCRYPTLEDSFWIGANGHMQLRAGNAAGMLKLLRTSREDKLSLEQAYCLLQDSFERAWRTTLAERRGEEIWTGERCLAAMKSLEGEMSAAARRLFGTNGLIMCGDLIIRDVSSPLYI